MLGTGKKDMEADVEALDKEFPETVKGVVKFNVPLAHLIIAGTSQLMLLSEHFMPLPVASDWLVDLHPKRNNPLCMRQARTSCWCPHALSRAASSSSTP